LPHVFKKSGKNIAQCGRAFHDAIQCMFLYQICLCLGGQQHSISFGSGFPDGRLLYRLKRRWRDGTTQVIYEPLEFMEKLAALVPPPGV
jgi:hypothetical protein